ncbi:MAG: NAD(P)-dependent oxidoreductase [Acidobacteriota bacterium]
MKIGFIGLGSMGQPMARNILKAGHSLTVYNRSGHRAEELREEGATIADSVADACRGEAVITMLSDDEALETVAFGESGIISTLSPRSIHISMSTVSFALSARLAEAHSSAGSGLVAAPVFGRPPAAAAAQLFILAAGSNSDIERCRPLFDAMGQKTFVIGDDPSAANIVKLIGNFLLASLIESLGEAFALGRKAGLDPQTLLEILTGTIFPAPVYKNYGQMIAEQKYEPAGFKLSLGLKDVRLALEAAASLNVPMPSASLARDHFITALARGREGLDWCALASVCAEEAGL